MRLLRVLTVTASLLFPFVTARDADPSAQVFKKQLDHPVAFLFYFEDSPVVLALDEKSAEVWRSGDNGEHWETVAEAKGKAQDMMQHPHDNKRAVIFGDEKTHWATKDQGKTWQEFKTEFPVTVSSMPLSFNAQNPDYALYAARKCDPDDFWGIMCEDQTYYTKDWFGSELKLLAKDTHSCLFARGAKGFQHAKDTTVLCVVDGEGKYPEHRKLVISDDFFEHTEEPKLDGYNVIEGLSGLAAVQKWIVAAVRSKGTDEMALYVTDNGTQWHRAVFPHDHGGLREDAYTILESTPYSIQVDVLPTHESKKSPIGSLFTSNSNGTYFTRSIDHTNRISEGLVDFEKVEGIQGIVLANVVDNFEDIQKNPNARKKVKSKISFDDGKWDTWQPLRIVDDENKELHLWSVTGMANTGRVFSSRAPGLLMGAGSVGAYLDPYTECDTYVSDDAGMTWYMGLREAHKYEFGGAGSILVAVYDEGPTNKVSYSINRGKNWTELDLGDNIRAGQLTTTPDSTSLNFILTGVDSQKKGYIFYLDFNIAFDRKCELNKDDEKKSDFEKWYARYDNDKKPDCLMGHKEFYWRRKKDADCYVGDLYNEPEVETEVCECQEQDFECDFNFVKNDGKCELAPGAKLPIPPDACKKPDDKWKGPSGYRKIPGNTCNGGIDKEGTKDRDCGEANSAPSTGDIVSKFEEFKAKKPVEYFYLENAESASKSEETIFMRTDRQEVFVSHDGGREWEQVLKDITVLAIYPHQYHYDHVYFITKSEEVWYTDNRGHKDSFKKFKAPSPPNREGLPVLDFHPTQEKWLIWTGQKDCDSPVACHSIAYFTKDIDLDWKPFMSHCGKCKFIRGQKQPVYSEKLIFCERVKKNGEHTTVQLVSSTDFFDAEQTHFENIIGYAKMEEFIVVASINGEDGFLKASASIDGKTFADAHFPHNFNVPHQTAYTVLDSVTHSVFLHVTVNDREGYEFGSLLKSNSNGTNYVLSLDAVNRNDQGFVDFEKMHSIEGVVLVNRVANAKAAADGEKKKLRTMITHNDGGEWNYIPAPEKDSTGKKFDCDVGKPDKCSLNLHHYTERTDPRHTFASASAVGLMLGLGNVGDSLKGFADGDTFLTRDGGLTWTEVRKGPHLWEYGDQGSIIVIVDRSKPTDTVYYTLDEGKSWVEYKFGDKMKVTDISTVPTDTSRRFLLWGYKEGEGEKFYTVHLDFSGITDQQCNLAEDEDKQDHDDFYLWSGDDRCLFGHVAQYHRKFIDHRCYIGRKVPKLHKILKNCTCSNQDYECDFNYERREDGTCQLIDGLTPPDTSGICKTDAIEYWEPTGYRKLPMSTCEGGKQLDRKVSKPCKGKEEEYNKRHRGLSGFGLFMAIVLPFAAAGGIGWWIWTHLLGRRFGAIRLGEDHRESPLVQYPIIAISAIVAVLAAVPVILGAAGRWVSTKFQRPRRYTTRSSFARGAYSSIATDEGELLGSDDEDDV